MKLPYSATVTHEEETIKIAHLFSQLLKKGDIVALNGDLGSGKTFFVKHAAKIFKIEKVNSPSFSIVNEYYGTLNIYHLDFYRLVSSQELYNIGFNDYLNDENSILFIECANLFSEVLPQKYYTIQIEINENFSRKIDIKKVG